MFGHKIKREDNFEVELLDLLSVELKNCFSIKRRKCD